MPSKPYAETRVKSAAPTHTTRCVRSPAWRSRSSRSNPIAPPSTAATTSRSSTCGQLSCGTRALRKVACKGIGLFLSDQPDPSLRQRQQLVQALPRERILLGRRLHLDQPAVAGHHDVHVGVGVRVL